MDTQTLVIALIGGVGGAFLSGIFQALTGLFADKRRQRHELDAWLREQRFKAFNDMAVFLHQAWMEEDEDRWDSYLARFWTLMMPLKSVMPPSFDPEWDELIAEVSEALEGSVRDSHHKFMLVSAEFSGKFPAAMGWTQEPLGGLRNRWRHPTRWERFKRVLLTK